MYGDPKETMIRKNFELTPDDPTIILSRLLAVARCNMFTAVSVLSESGMYRQHIIERQDTNTNESFRIAKDDPPLCLKLVTTSREFTHR